MAEAGAGAAESKLWTELEPKINNFGSTTLDFKVYNVPIFYYQISLIMCHKKCFQSEIFEYN